MSYLTKKKWSRKFLTNADVLYTFVPELFRNFLQNFSDHRLHPRGHVLRRDHLLRTGVNYIRKIKQLACCKYGGVVYKWRQSVVDQNCLKMIDVIYTRPRIYNKTILIYSPSKIIDYPLDRDVICELPWHWTHLHFRNCQDFWIVAKSKMFIKFITKRLSLSAGRRRPY